MHAGTCSSSRLWPGAGHSGSCSPAPHGAGCSLPLSLGPPSAGGASAAAGGQGRRFRRREVTAWSSAPLPGAVAAVEEERSGAERAAGVSVRARRQAPHGSAMSYCRQEGAHGCPHNVTPRGQAGRALHEAVVGRCGAAVRSPQPLRGRRSLRGEEAAGCVWRREELFRLLPPTFLLTEGGKAVWAVRRERAFRGPRVPLGRAG